MHQKHHSNLDKDGIPRLSKSALQTFRQCPEKFKYVYIDHLPDLGGAESMLGKKIHEVFFEYHKTLNVEKVKSEKDLVVHAELFKENHYAKHLGHFVDFTCDMYRNLKNKTLVRPILAEEKFIHPTMHLSGLVDAVFQDDDGNCLVMDYKSGKFDQRKIPEYRMELSVYAEFVKLRTSYTPTHWGIFFSSVGVRWTEPVDPKYFDEVVVPLYNSTRASIKKKQYLPNIGPLCMYCPFKNRCSAWGGIKDPRLKE